MPERLDAGHLLVGAGGLVLLISLFLDWFDPGITAWTAFEVLDLVLAGVAVVAILGLLRRLLGSHVPAPAHASHPVLGVIALVLVGAALINHPPAAIGSSPDTGAWLALAGALVMALGGLLGFGRISVVITRSGSSGAAPDERWRRPSASDPTERLGFEERPGAETETRELRSRRR